MTWDVESIVKPKSTLLQQGCQPITLVAPSQGLMKWNVVNETSVESSGVKVVVGENGRNPENTYLDSVSSTKKITRSDRDANSVDHACRTITKADDMKQNEWVECGKMVEWNLWQRKTGETPRKSTETSFRSPRKPHGVIDTRTLPTTPHAPSQGLMKWNEMNELSVEKLWNEISVMGKLKKPRENLSRLRFVHQENHKEWSIRKPCRPYLTHHHKGWWSETKWMSWVWRNCGMKFVTGENGRNPEKNYLDSVSSTKKTTWSVRDAISGPQRWEVSV